MKRFALVALLALPACQGADLESLQSALTKTEELVERTQGQLDVAEKTLVTTQFALNEAMEQGLGPAAIARAQNTVNQAMNVVNDLKTTLLTVEAEKAKWQSAVDEAKSSGATNLDLTKLIELGATSLLSILGAVKTTNVLRDKARVARNEPTGLSVPTKKA